MRYYQRRKAQRRRLVREAVQILLSRAEEAAARGHHTLERACLQAIHAYRKKYHIPLGIRDRMRYCPACYHIYPSLTRRRIKRGPKGLTLSLTCPICGHRRMVLIRKRDAQDTQKRTT